MKDESRTRNTSFILHPSSFRTPSSFIPFVMTPERWQRIDQVFQAALACAPTERGRWLDENCAGDAELRAEVESLLAAHERAGSFIQAPALEIAAQMATPQTGAAVGRPVGPYQITKWLGAGGMGEVYLAFDPRLERQVALKFLPDYLINDQQRVRRFKQEARAASALSHPNVATIYEIGEAEGATYIAMEYVAGQTLSERINGQPLPLDQIIGIASQAADALDEAHARGVTHRDIKSLNLMITERGRVKVLDFGLAKMSRHDALEPVDAVGDRAANATPGATLHSLATTAPGLVMGTAQYMSPEQALAQEVDHRTDIFSLGVVMYEMATGRLPFNGTSVPSVIERVLHAEPEALTGLNPAVPRTLELMILRCLAKQPAERYQSARALWNDLQALRRDAGEVRRWSKARRWLGIGTTGVLTAGLALGSLLWSRLARPDPKAPLPLLKPVPLTIYEGEELFPALSPDGQQVAFCWRNAVTQETDVYVKAIGAETPTRLTYSEDYEHSPVWSPDGRFIAFIHNERGEGKSGIFVVPAAGGAERKLYPLRHNQTTNGLDWSADGKLLVFTSRDTDTEAYGLQLLELDTLTTRRLTRPPADSQGDQLCVFSPDGQSVAFVRNFTELADLYLVAVSGGEPTRLNQGNDRFYVSDLAWWPDGGSLIYSGDRFLWRVNARGGRPEPLAVPAIDMWSFALSRSGGRLVYCDWQLNANIWRGTLPSASRPAPAPAKLIASSRIEIAGSISPDGERIVFISDRSGPKEVWRCQSDGSQPVQLTSFNMQTGNPRWSPDGREIVFSARHANHHNLYVIKADGGQPRRLTEGSWNDMAPCWAADGAWIYFGSNRSGNWEIWRTPPNGGPATQVTGQGGYEAQVAPDGRFIYYTKRDFKKIYRLPVTGGAEQFVCELFNAGRAHWALVKEGIYFIRWWGTHDTLNFFNFATQQANRKAALPGDPSGEETGLSLSPDGRWFIYTQEEQRNVDLWLVENFR
jgi:eukaryotic-like serine/threonine-protein kinase